MNLWRLRMLTAASIHKLLPSSPRQPPVRCGSSHVDVFHPQMKFTQPEAKPVLFLCKFQVIFCKKEAHQAALMRAKGAGSRGGAGQVSLPPASWISKCDRAGSNWSTRSRPAALAC